MLRVILIFNLKPLHPTPFLKNTPFYPYNKEWNTTSSNEQLYMLLPPNQPVAAINAQLAQFSKAQFKGQQGYNAYDLSQAAKHFTF